jgi:RHS repeat-associated protein
MVHIIESIEGGNIVTRVGTKQSSYRYDASSIRASQTMDGVETKYLIDANRPYAQVLEEYNGSGVQTSYVYGNDLISQSRNGSKSFYLEDGHSGVRQLANSSGSVTDSYNYDAYGMLLRSNGSTSNSYLYRGEQFDKGLNQYYLRAREYNPALGRLNSVDPLEGNPMEPMSRHRFLYGNANPVTFQDPSGMFSISVGQTIAILGIVQNTLAGLYTLGISQALIGYGLGRDLYWTGNLSLLKADPVLSAEIGLLDAQSIDQTISPYGTGASGNFDGRWLQIHVGISIPTNLTGFAIPLDVSFSDVTIVSPRQIGAQPGALTGSFLLGNAAAGLSSGGIFIVGFGIGTFTSYEALIDSNPDISGYIGISVPISGNFTPSNTLPPDWKEQIRRRITKGRGFGN